MILRAAATVLTGAVVPGTIGTPAAAIVSRARVFVPIASIAAAGGPMKTMPSASQRAAKAGVLGEEAVARVDRLRARLARDRDDPVDVQVALGRRRAAEQVRLAGAGDVRRVAVDLRVDADARDPELFERAHDADRDLAAVGDQDLREHRG